LTAARSVSAQIHAINILADNLARTVVQKVISVCEWTGFVGCCCNLPVYCRLLSKNLKIKIYRTIILPVILYGCEAWSLTLREERRLKVFENRVLRRVFGPKKDEVTG
jgi:hypothetical protein